MVFGHGRDQQKPDHKAIEAKVDEEMHGLVTQLTNEITFHMRECGLSRAELAATDGRLARADQPDPRRRREPDASHAGRAGHRPRRPLRLRAQQPEDPDEYTSRGTAEPAPAANHHSFPRTQHQRGASRPH